jgi:hypothetical protein
MASVATAGHCRAIGSVGSRGRATSSQASESGNSHIASFAASPAIGCDCISSRSVASIAGHPGRSPVTTIPAKPVRSKAATKAARAPGPAIPAVASRKSIPAIFARIHTIGSCGPIKSRASIGASATVAS